MYIQCAARISRHCAISQFALISLFSWLPKSWFLSAKLLNFRSFLRPGTVSGRVLGWLWFFRGFPPKVSMDPLFAVSRGVFFFFECSCFWIFVILSAQTLHSGFHFDCFWGALGLLKNSWKCLSVVNFRGLTPLGRSLFPGLDRECVLMLSF